MPDTLNSAELARLASISDRMARKVLRQCHEGKLWNGYQLRVRREIGRGGRAGAVYVVDVGSLPSDLRAKLPGPAPEPVPTPRPIAATPPTSAGLASWKLAAVRRVQQGSETGSADPVELIRKVAAETAWPSGRREGQPISETSLRNWIRCEEERGYGGLLRRQRADRGARRVIISKKWCEAAAAAGLDKAGQERIAEELDLFIKSSWASGVPGGQAAARDAAGMLAELTERFMPEMPQPELLKLCEVPIGLIRKHRVYRAVATRRKDAGRSAARQEPRIKRDRSHLRPMDSVIGDVTHLDVYIARPDDNGKISLVTPKLVSFYDKATNRVFGRLFLVPKGEMIRQGHVLRVVADMIADPAWGAPGNFYLDNGSEFQWDEIAAAICQLNPNIEIHLNIVTRAKPHNAPAKGSKEGFYSLLTRVWLPRLPGYIGGDRQRAKKVHQGRPPAPYPADMEALRADFTDFLGHYHAEPQQKGHLKGRSPDDAFARFVAEDWRATVVDRAMLGFVFAKIDTRMVRPGGVFSVDGIEYQHDSLIPLADSGQKAVLRISRIDDPSRIYVCDDTGDRYICTVEPRRSYLDGDREGAREQGRMRGVLNDDIRTKERETTRLDLRESAKRRRAFLPPAPTPNTPDRAFVSPAAEDAAAHARSLPAPVGDAARTPEELRRQQQNEKQLAYWFSKGLQDREPKARTG